MDSKKVLAPIEMLIAVTDRGKGKNVIKILNKWDSQYHLICLAKGTAESNIAEIFGFGITDRDLVIAIINIHHSEELLDEIAKELHLYIPTNGLAMTLPINSASSDMLDMLKIKYKEISNEGKK